MSTAGRFKWLAAAVVMTLGLAGCGEDSGANGGGGGGGGGNYKSVKIGTQTWMAENLNIAVEGSVCYDSLASNCAIYGRLYTWEAANKACPSGWHLPSYEEWRTLTDFVAGVGGNVAGTKLKSKTGWNNDGNGTDDFGFSALPGGGLRWNAFGGIGDNGSWWCATEEGETIARTRGMGYDSENVSWSQSIKTGQFSVRCVKD